MGKKAKTNLSVHRPKKGRTTKASVKPSNWPNTLDEILYKPARYKRVSWKITSFKIIKYRTHNVKRVTPLKYMYKQRNSPSTSTNKVLGAKSPYCVKFLPRKSMPMSPSERRSQSKIIFVRSPHQRIHIIKSTLSKSPAPKRVKRSLMTSYSSDGSNEYKNDIANDTADIATTGLVEFEEGLALEPTLDENNNCNGSCESSDVKEMLNLLPTVLDNLSNDGFDKTLLNFFKLVASKEFPMQNIAFLLWTEMVKWYTCKSTTEMRYSDATKKFWKLGYKLFGGRFVCFISGFKNSNQVIMQETSAGNYSPDKSDINFAVPDMKSLRDFEPYDIEYSNGSEKPGISVDMIKEMARSMEGKSCCVTFDGKKLKPGLTKTEGDVDMFGMEKGSSLSERQQCLKDVKKPFLELKEELSSSYSDDHDIKTISVTDKNIVLDTLMKALKMVSSEVPEVIELRKKKLYAKEKLIEKSDGDWKKQQIRVWNKCDDCMHS